MAACYFYSPQNFEFAGEGEYDGQQLPLNSTATAPPQPQQNVAYIWNAQQSQWDSADDYRGTQIYSTTDGHREVISSLGITVPVGYVTSAPPDAPATFPTQYTWNGNAWVLDVNKVTNAQALAVRAQRNALLAGTDWVEGPGVPIDATALFDFSKYRQLLRDLPSQGGFPATPTWPVPPVYVKDAGIDTGAAKYTAIRNGFDDAILNPIP